MAGQKRLGKNASVPSGYRWRKLRSELKSRSSRSRIEDLIGFANRIPRPWIMLFCSNVRKTITWISAAIEKFGNNQRQPNVSRRAQANMKVNVLTALR